MNEKFIIGLIQLALGKDQKENLNKAVSWIDKTAKKGAQVICLPELFRSQYFCQKEDINNFTVLCASAGNLCSFCIVAVGDSNYVGSHSNNGL